MRCTVQTCSSSYVGRLPVPTYADGGSNPAPAEHSCSCAISIRVSHVPWVLHKSKYTRGSHAGV